MHKSMLDTDILSEISKGINPNVARNATSYRNVLGQYTLSVISIMEVVRGFQKKQSLRRLQQFLTALSSEEIISFDEQAAEPAGRIAGDLDRNGQLIGRADPMIAAIAIGHSLEFVTGNTDHYRRIQQLGYPLQLVNWR
jgi:tRNA(fMet)-specific endonuclease VapC